VRLDGPSAADLASVDEPGRRDRQVLIKVSVAGVTFPVASGGVLGGSLNDAYVAAWGEAR